MRRGCACIPPQPTQVRGVALPSEISARILLSNFKNPRTMEPEGNVVHWDRSFLTGTAYGTSEKLSTRQAIYDFATTPARPGFLPWALSRVVWEGGELVLDLGCGNGRWLHHLAEEQPTARCIGLDLSEGMLPDLVGGWHQPSAPPVAVADVQALPIADASVDVVLLMHILHHVRSVSLALVEARRILRAQGTVVVTTPGSLHLRELRQLFIDAVTDVCGCNVPAAIVEGPFDTLTAERTLLTLFSGVEQYVEYGQLEIPDSSAIVAYLDSQRRPDLDVLLPASAVWGDVLHSAEMRAKAAIVTAGAFETRTHIDTYVCQQ